ncbi:S-layer homology domain-containing protein [Kovacikia minuta CCNUW1]|uniref:S-layer homology domain-containing protein n=1 Tax=Kovacikia minuta TaxID=2931930 RepID=UPI001CCD8B56|nr:S-layer homology domain-containing protein [Kovacikia minuta]UBF27546.1 S-layer homology domain-containing protein [Kovacikia minuta CCNUW1]
MSNSNPWRSGTALLVALGMTAGTVAPFVIPAPAFAQKTFPDVPPTYWAAPFIQELSARGIIVGFAEDGTFRPEEPVTRAQFASMIRRAFNRPPIRNPIRFTDVPEGYWAAGAIEEAYTTGFMAGYPGNQFRPYENIPRAQILVSLASGLNFANTAPVNQVLLAYADAGDIPRYARPGVAATTERQVVVNYPDIKLLNPNRAATRAEVAAFIYQALVSQGQAAVIPSPYIVGQQPPGPVGVKIPAGTPIPARYEGGDRILLARNETQSVPLTLKIAQNVVTNQGQVLIPAGSDVTGQLQTVQGGAQFIANEIILPDGQRLPFSATSDLLNNYYVVRREPSTGRIILGTLVGAGAGAGVAAVTGDRHIKAWEVLTGAAAGALVGTFLGGTSVEAIAIEPGTNITLTLTSDLVIGSAPPPPIQPRQVEPAPEPVAPSEAAPEAAPAAPAPVTPQKY